MPFEAPVTLPGSSAFRALSFAGAGAARAASAALNFAIPPQCLACSRPVTSVGCVCASCWSGLCLIERPFCERLGTPFPADYGPGLLSPAAIANPPAYDRARAVARFDGAARELVHRLKYAMERIWPGRSAR